MERVFLLLGSNLGDRAGQLKQARHLIAECAAVITESSIYQTQAWGKTDQPEFYNQVLEIATTLEPQPLLTCLLRIENRLGRKRLDKWGARVIDIDILLYGDVVLNTEALVIPHAQMAVRRFTLTPLAEIAGNVQHPSMQKPITQLLAECPDELKVEKVKL